MKNLKSICVILIVLLIASIVWGYTQMRDLKTANASLTAAEETISAKDAEIQKLNTDHTAAIEALTAENTAAIETLTAENTAATEALQAEHTAKIDELNAALAAKEAELTELNATIDQKVAEKYAAIIEENTKLKAQIASLQAEGLLAEDEAANQG